MPSNTPSALTFMMRCQLSSVTSRNISGLLMPALLTMTFNDPKASTVAFTAAVISSRLVTSSLTAMA